MQLFPHRIGPSATSHVDQDLDVVNPNHPAYAIARALADGEATPQEARVAMAMAISEDGLKSFRHIEEASGLTDDTLLKILPEAGGSTTLLSCTNRGRFAFEAEDRRHIELHLRPYRSSPGHHCSLSSNSTNDQRSRGSNDLDHLDDVEEEPKGVREMSKDELELMDPSLDVWKNASEGWGERQEFGDAGWALAVVTRMRATVFALDEISRIIRVGERQTRRIIDRLEACGWARRVREGRYVRVVVDFSLMNHEDLRTDWLKHARRARKALVHQREGRVLKRLGTKVGRMVRDMWRDKRVEFQMLTDWAVAAGSWCFDTVIAVLGRSSCREDPLNGLTRWEAEDALFACYETLLKP